MTFRIFLRWMHLILGLTAAVVLAIISVTGAYITFQDPLQRWLTPVPRVTRASGPVDMVKIVTTVDGRFPSTGVATVDVREREATVVRLRDGTTVFVHPDSATIIASRPGRFASLENLTLLMRGLHTNLVIGPTGRAIVTIATAEAFLLVLTGLWLWWKKKHWQFRPWRGSLFRVSWDLHNATGIWFAVPVLAMVITGLLLAIPAPVYRLAGSQPAPWPAPPRSTADVGQGTARLVLARVLSVADSALPGRPTTRLAIPSEPAGAFAVGKPPQTVYIDQFSGTILDIRAERALTAGDSASMLVEHVHTGEQFGMPGRGMMTLGSLMLAVMTLTGAVLGVKRLMILARARADEGESP